MKIPSRLLLTCLCAQFYLIACSGENGSKPGKEDADAPAAPEMPPDVKFGDGIGTHGVSLETQAERQIKEMIANGADPQKPHRIEYHLRADSLKTAQAIVAWGEENGFETTAVDEENIVRGEWIFVDLVKNSKLEGIPQ